MQPQQTQQQQQQPQQIPNQGYPQQHGQPAFNVANPNVQGQQGYHGGYGIQQQQDPSKNPRLAQSSQKRN